MNLKIYLFSHSSQNNFRQLNMKIYILKVVFSRDGRHIVSGWSDGAVRFHTPETGKLVQEVKKQTIDICKKGNL
jgi:hypothetical protein